MPNYLVMIYDNEAELATVDDATIERNHRRHGAFAQANGGALRGGARLADSGTATSIRPAADGGVTVTDGTFAETKEVMGGFYIIEADDLDQAIAIASQVPSVSGGVEIRPIIPS